MLTFALRFVRPVTTARGNVVGGVRTLVEAVPLGATALDVDDGPVGALDPDGVPGVEPGGVVVQAARSPAATRGVHSRSLPADFTSSV